jgi:integrase
MSRKPHALGTWGDIRVQDGPKDEKGKVKYYRAIAHYRDYGVTRQVERTGRSKAAATNRLRIALKERSGVGSAGNLQADQRFAVAAELWLRRFEGLVQEERRSPGSLETYRRQVRLHVLPALGELRLAEVTTPVVDKFVSRIKADIGASTARTCRSVVSGVMGLAVRYGALSANPVREVDRVEGTPKKEPRALTEAERAELFAQLQADEVAVRKDLPDLVSFMLATGVRIGEALAVLWCEVDLGAGTVHITSTIIRVTGVGLIRKPTKSRAGQRILSLPPWAVAILRRRYADNPYFDRPVFPDTLGGFRDPSNTRRDIRDARGTEGLSWVTSHNFRKTTATILDDAGLSPRAVADQLGHARPSMTQDVYLGRKVVNPAAAAALEVALATRSDENHGKTMEAPQGGRLR